MNTVSNLYVNSEDTWASPQAVNEEMGSPEKPGDSPHARELAGVRGWDSDPSSGPTALADHRIKERCMLCNH